MFGDKDKQQDKRHEACLGVNLRSHGQEDWWHFASGEGVEQYDDPQHDLCHGYKAESRKDLYLALEEWS